MGKIEQGVQDRAPWGCIYVPEKVRCGLNGRMARINFALMTANLGNRPAREEEFGIVVHRNDYGTTTWARSRMGETRDILVDQVILTPPNSQIEYPFVAIVAEHAMEYGVKPERQAWINRHQEMQAFSMAYIYLGEDNGLFHRGDLLFDHPEFFQGTSGRKIRNLLRLEEEARQTAESALIDIWRKAGRELTGRELSRIQYHLNILTDGQARLDLVRGSSGSRTFRLQSVDTTGQLQERRFTIEQDEGKNYLTNVGADVGLFPVTSLWKAFPGIAHPQMARKITEGYCRHFTRYSRIHDG